METLDHFTISGNMNQFVDGMQLVTNAYRNELSTGAANPMTETLVIPKAGLIVPPDNTPDYGNILPISQNFEGPGSSWAMSTCPERRSIRRDTAFIATNEIENKDTNGPENETIETRQSTDTGCDLVEAPRLAVPTSLPTGTPSVLPTSTPTLSTSPTTAPIVNDPTGAPSIADAGREPSAEPAPSPSSSVGAACGNLLLSTALLALFVNLV
jgi:hypothetical protein